MSPNTKPAADGEPPVAASSLTIPIRSGETHVTREDTPQPLEASSPSDVNLSSQTQSHDRRCPPAVQVTLTDDIEVKKEEMFVFVGRSSNCGRRTFEYNGRLFFGDFCGDFAVVIEATKYLVDSL